MRMIIMMMMMMRMRMRMIIMMIMMMMMMMVMMMMVLKGASCSDFRHFSSCHQLEPIRLIIPMRLGLQVS